MNERRRVFTPENVSFMKQMAADGLSAPAIAKALGSTAGSVRVTCSHQGIRLKRGRARRSAPPSKLIEQGGHVPVIAYMPSELYNGFHSTADALQKPVGTLAGMLLSAIISDDLYKAVLDE
jgi:hypothetical protein